MPTKRVASLEVVIDFVCISPLPSYQPYVDLGGGRVHQPRGVHVPNNLILWIWGMVIIVQVLGKYMIIRYLDPEGKHGWLPITMKGVNFVFFAWGT